MRRRFLLDFLFVFLLLVFRGFFFFFFGIFNTFQIFPVTSSILVEQLLSGLNHSLGRYQYDDFGLAIVGIGVYTDLSLAIWGPCRSSIDVPGCIAIIEGINRKNDRRLSINGPNGVDGVVGGLNLVVGLDLSHVGHHNPILLQPLSGKNPQSSAWNDTFFYLQRKKAVISSILEDVEASLIGETGNFGVDESGDKQRIGAVQRGPPLLQIH